MDQEHPKLVQLSTDRMEAVADLASTNMRTSEARNMLAEAEGALADYLVKREGFARAVIDNLLDETNTALADTTAAIKDTAAFAREAMQFADRVIDLFNGVSSVMEEFDKKSALWEKNVADREGRLAEGQQHLASARKALEGDRKFLSEKALALDAAERRLASDRVAAADISKKVKEVK